MNDEVTRSGGGRGEDVGDRTRRVSTGVGQRHRRGSPRRAPSPPSAETAAPDLAIEVVWASGGLDKLAIYAPLGVREVWTWKAGRLAVHVLRGGAYVTSTRSEVLPGIDLDLLVRFVDRADQTDAVHDAR